MRASALVGSNAADHLRAVGDGLLGVEGPLLPREALANHPRVLVDPDLRGRAHRPRIRRRDEERPSNRAGRHVDSKQQTQRFRQAAVRPTGDKAGRVLACKLLHTNQTELEEAVRRMDASLAALAVFKQQVQSGQLDAANASLLKLKVVFVLEDHKCCVSPYRYSQIEMTKFRALPPASEEATPTAAHEILIASQLILI